MEPHTKKLIVVAGPTAVGKTALAIELAKHFKTEIISADSRQFYRELTIGTAKPGTAERTQVIHHFIDNLSIEQEYDAAQFGKEALETIKNIFLYRDHIVLCGGSGLYIKAVIDGFDEIPEVSREIRKELTEQFEIHGVNWLKEQLHVLDPESFYKIDQDNPHRLMRALEVKIGTGQSIFSFRRNEKLKHDFKIVKIGLELPREVLYKRIDERMDEMIACGLFNEAEGLYAFKTHNALQTVGYQEIFEFMDGLFDRDEAIRLLKRNSRRYAKRQLTWFRRDDEMKWFSPYELNQIIDYIKSI